LSSFAAAAVTTHWAETVAAGLFTQHAWRTAAVAMAYLGVSGLLFLVKFALYDRVVFVFRAGETPVVQTTRS
jgi:hypothetical protein